MSGLLVPRSSDPDIVNKYATDDIFEDIAKSNSWLPYLQLFGSNAKLVKQRKIPQGHYGLVIQKDNIEDLGEEVDVLALEWRPKAMRMTDGGTPISFYDPKSQEFAAVMKDAKDKDSGCMFGPEFLLWVPSSKRFAGYFMNNVTARNRAGELRHLIGMGATLKVQFIENKRFSWHGPLVVACPTKFEIPTMEEIDQQRKLFNNPESSSVEFDVEKMEADTPPNSERAR